MYSFDKVTDGLYLGNELTACKKQLLKRGQVTHILIAGVELTPHFPDEFQYLRLAMKDSPSEDLLRHLEQAIAFIDQARAVGGTVFIHCFQGVSRSSALAIGFLMHKERLSFVSAYRLVKERHVETTPNPGFICQLMSYEKKVRQLNWLRSEEDRRQRSKSCACVMF